MSDTEIARLRADLDKFPSFAEVSDMGDRLAPLADRLEALGMTSDAETIRVIIDPQSTIGELREENAKLRRLYTHYRRVSDNRLIEMAEHGCGD